MLGIHVLLQVYENETQIFIYHIIYYLIHRILLFYQVLDNFDFCWNFFDGSIDRSIDETIDRSIEQG